MSSAENTTEHTFDASKRKLGRISSEIAEKLMGKDRVDYTRHQAPDITVTVKNSSDLDITDDKLRKKTYTRYSGHPGGKKEDSAQHVVNTHGYGELIKRAVYGMLPDNKLRDEMMKNLKTEE